MADPTPNIDKWALWTSGKTLLRGANVFQRTMPNGEWCSKLSADFFKDLAAAGANYVNLSIPGTYNVKPPLPHDPNAPWQSLYGEIGSARTRLDELTDWAKDEGLWIVLSFRSAPGRSETDVVAEGSAEIVRDLFSPKPEFSAQPREAFADMWRTIARRFKNHANIAAYDLLVEPHRPRESPQGEQWSIDPFRETWRNIACETIKAIRAEDRLTPIIVGIDEDSSMLALPNWKPLGCVDPANALRVVYGLHQYEPFEYTHESEPFDPVFTKLLEMFAIMDNWQTANPGWHFAVNEFGVKCDQQSAAKFIEKEFGELTKRGCNHAIWLWDDPKGGCYDPKMSLTEKPTFFKAVKNEWAKNKVGP